MDVIDRLKSLVESAQVDVPAAQGNTFGESAGCDDTADAIGGAEHYRVTCPVCGGVTQCRCNYAQHEGVEVFEASVVCERCKASVGESVDGAQSVATEILRQLGGQKLRAMLGMKGYLVVDASEGFSGGVDFKFPNKTKTAPNRVEILLADDDTYTVRFYRDSRKLKEHDGIYADGLIDVFESETGLYLALSRR